MTENTKIEWADHTFNPWVGCTKISPGCDHCYAEGWAKRSGMVQWGDNPRKRTSIDNWNKPWKWNRMAAAAGIRYRVFCASLADIFDKDVPVQWRVDLFRLIAQTPNLDWLLLTKRIGNAWPMMLEVSRLCAGGENPMPNVWLGATVVNQDEADRDIPKLLAVPARIRFLSCEPLLGPLNIESIPYQGEWLSAFNNDAWPHFGAVHWVIVGGESGHHARPMNPAWARSLRDQCNSAQVPYLFKQWGEFIPADQPESSRFGYENENCEYHWDNSDCNYSIRVGKHEAGRILDGRTWDEFPQLRVTN